MQVTSGTIARTVVLVIALVNQILTATGHAVLPIESETVNELIAVSFTIVTSLIAWWKNNSFTKAAIIGDKAMKEAKSKSE